ncbi:MAG: hypothetical protein KDJ52_05335 [Anaerolineae bacterium]|nr:hypothetical protein [Anaerolineae bacterium]
MPGKRHISFYMWSIVILLLASFVTACSSNEPTRELPEGIRTQLLVKPPETALPVGSPLTVRSQTEAVTPGVSHVELYAVQLPSGEQDKLIRSDAAPFDQTTFTAAQRFTPIQPGHYVIKVVGYNRSGQSAESEYISFDVE